MNSKKIGIFICELRNEKKWTQEELAEKLFVDRTLVSKWERGVYIPNTEILLKMQALFNVSINEILFGERKNQSNSNNVAIVPVQIMKDEEKKKRKILFTSLVIILVIIFFFLSYYFINNYNSIKVYRISGENADFSLTDGILVFSKEKSYIRVGTLQLKDSKKITSVKLYFMKNDEIKQIFEGGLSDLNILFENTFNYNELFKYDDLQYIISNLKLDFELDNNEIKTLDLRLVKAYENNKIFNEYKETISDNNKNTVENRIPEYIKQNFSYIESTESYVKENENTKEEFFYNVGVYQLTIYNDKYNEEYFYYLSDNTLNYDKFINDEIVEYYVYDYNTSKCEQGNCNIDNIIKIKEKYLDLINK